MLRHSTTVYKNSLSASLYPLTLVQFVVAMIQLIKKNINSFT